MVRDHGAVPGLAPAQNNRIEPTQSRPTGRLFSCQATHGRPFEPSRGAAGTAPCAAAAATAARRPSAQ
nr:MAG TPA: hypothetical protein [Caudoviricetes sp.]